MTAYRVVDTRHNSYSTVKLIDKQAKSDMSNPIIQDAST